MINDSAPPTSSEEPIVTKNVVKVRQIINTYSTAIIPLSECSWREYGRPIYIHENNLCNFFFDFDIVSFANYFYYIDKMHSAY